MTTRPRTLAGDISDMYAGDTVEPTPTPRPTTKRPKTMSGTSSANAMINGPTRKNPQLMPMVVRRPMSINSPAIMVPKTAPIFAPAITMPTSAEVHVLHSSVSTLEVFKKSESSGSRVRFHSSHSSCVQLPRSPIM